MSVAIVGGGVTGLTAALLLQQQGCDVTVYEAADRTGGLAGTFRVDGYAFDFGPHEFCTQNRELIDLLEDVCGDDLILVEKNIAQYFRQRYVKYPFEVADVLKNIGLGLSMRAAFEAMIARMKAVIRPRRSTSFKDWTQRRFGDTLYRTYFGPYTEKVWGVDPDELDPRTAAQRITVDSVWDLVRRTIAFQLLRREDWRRAHSEYRRGFRYVRGGIGNLHAHLERAFVDRGGRIETSMRLSKIERSDDGRISKLGFENGESRSGHDAVISTIPLPALVRLAIPEGAALIDDNPLPFRGMIFCFLRIARQELGRHHWIYFPDPDIPFQRLTEFKHFDASMAPKDRTGILLEIAANPDEPIWQANDEQIIEKCVQSLKALDLAGPEEIEGYDVVRVPHAYPLQIKGFIERTDSLVDALDVVPNLTTIGRQGLFRYCNMNECMEMAMAVAPRIADGEELVRFDTTSSWEGVALTDRSS